MTGAEAADALREHKPVVCNGIVFRQMQKIIYECYAGFIDVSAEMTDKTGRSTLTASIRSISLAEPNAAVPSPPDLPVESVTMHTCVGDYRIDMRCLSDGSYTATENGIYAQSGADSPFNTEEDAADVLNEILCRLRDVTGWVMASWRESHSIGQAFTDKKE